MGAAIDRWQESKLNAGLPAGQKQMLTPGEWAKVDANLYRLKTANYGDGQSQTYTFDPMGNRTGKTDNVTGNETYEFDAANRLTYRYSGTRPSSPNVVSDPNGNVLSDGTRTNVWDSENRLRQSVKGTKTSTFTYGADGLRRTMSVSDSATPANNLSKTFLLDNGMQVAERQKTGTAATSAPSPTDPLSVTYLQGARGPECMRDEKKFWSPICSTDGLVRSPPRRKVNCPA